MAGKAGRVDVRKARLCCKRVGCESCVVVAGKQLHAQAVEATSCSLSITRPFACMLTSYFQFLRIILWAFHPSRSLQTEPELVLIDQIFARPLAFGHLVNLKLITVQGTSPVFEPRCKHITLP
jgi:hypothetical protein